MNAKKIVVMLVSLPKTILFNFKSFSCLVAMKLPVFISYNTKIESCHKGSIQLDEVKTGIIKIGFGGSFAIGNKGFWQCDGKIYFKGSASIGRGSQVIVGNDGQIIFGNHFEGNANCIYNSSELLTIGDNCLVGWGSTLIDGDGHTIIHSNGVKSSYGSILIGNHVWICSDVKILKNSVIQDNSIIASNALISKKFIESNLLIGGHNKILEKSVSWTK